MVAEAIVTASFMRAIPLKSNAAEFVCAGSSMSGSQSCVCSSGK